MTLDFEIDEAFVSRLVLGALSEHEQRMLAVALARSDPGFRRSLRSILEPFETFDGDLTAEYAAVLGIMNISMSMGIKKSPRRGFFFGL